MKKLNDIDYLCAGINHMAFYKKFEKKINENEKKIFIQN